MFKKVPHRVYLTEEQLPKEWYNIRADMKEQPDPMLNPATLQPVTAEDLYPVFCQDLAEQELDSSTRYFEIPDAVAYFGANWTVIPAESGHRIRVKLDTNSGGNWTPIPV